MMTYEKMSRAMRYHYGSKKQNRKGHLAMVKGKRLIYRFPDKVAFKQASGYFARFGELAVTWRRVEMGSLLQQCDKHWICMNKYGF